MDDAKYSIAQPNLSFGANCMHTTVLSWPSKLLVNRRPLPSNYKHTFIHTYIHIYLEPYQSPYTNGAFKHIYSCVPLPKEESVRWPGLEPWLPMRCMCRNGSWPCRSAPSSARTSSAFLNRKYTATIHTFIKIIYHNSACYKLLQYIDTCI